MNERWLEWSEKYLELTAREKVIIALTSVFLVVYLGYLLVVEPQVIANNKIKNQLHSAAGQLATTRNQIADIKAALNVDPNEALKVEIKGLRQQLTHLEQALKRATQDYVAPEQMTKELTSLLSTSPNVKVIAVEALRPETITVAGPESDVEAEDESMIFYRHKFSVTLQGDYFALMAFVEKVVEKNKEFAVSDLDYNVVEHPTANMTLSLETISDSENVIRL
jgi:MSHA biogenesis protein MshJ